MPHYFGTAHNAELHYCTSFIHLQRRHNGEPPTVETVINPESE